MNKLLDQYLKIREASNVLGVRRNTLTRMIEEEEVEAVDIYRPGGQYAVYRIRAESLGDITDRIAQYLKAGGEVGEMPWV